MKFIKFKKMRSFLALLLITGLSFIACKDNSVSSLTEEEEVKFTTDKGNYLILPNAQATSNIVIDDFDSGAVTIEAAGSNVFNFHEDTGISGGAREITIRDAFSGQFGGRAKATVDINAGTLAFYVSGRVAPEHSVQYGTMIGQVYKRGVPGVSPNTGTELNLDLTLDDMILIEVAATGTSSGVNIVLRSGNGAVNTASFTLNVGTNLISLADFANLTEVAASDVDGIAISGLNTFSSFAFKTSAPEVTNNVYISDSSVQTWDPIFPSFADPNWSSTVCYQGNDFGISANWTNPHNAFEVTQDNGQPHPWDNSTFDAAWINSYNDMDSEGPGGHNWSKYEKDVVGNGDFVIQLLADNCSWVYLADENGNNPQLVGYQPAVSTPGEYGVTLDGAHKLTFVIFDGGGLAGGKFRLETTESYGGTPPPPIATNNAPVADAGDAIIKDATGSTTPISLDGSGSSDSDGDVLSYSWTIDGNEVANTATATINLADGDYTVMLTVSDGELSDTDELSVSVVNTIPVADAGPNQTKEATGPTTTVTLSGSGTDADGDALTYSWSNGDAGASTTVDLTVGVHTFTLMVSDGQGASDTDEVTVEITDTTAPVLSFTQETNSLWPPNHKMVLVASGISASDIVDGSTAVEVTVSSNESPNGKGDGNTAVDYEVVTNFDGSKDVYVRAERSGKGSGRTYTISLSSNDGSNNRSLESFEVSTNKSQGNGQIKATGKKNK